MVKTGGPAIGAGRTCHTNEVVVVLRRGVWRRNDGPRDSVPALGQCVVGTALVNAAIKGAGVMEPDNPAVRSGGAGYTVKDVLLRGTRVRRAGDGP